MIESFQYDDLDRLTSYGKSGSTMTTLNYADNGNIQNSTKVGSYSYALPNKPYAATDVDNSSYDIPSVNQNISYSSFRRPTSITEGSNSLSYKYNSSFDRVKGIANIGGETTTTHYFGKGVYNHVNSSNSTKNRESLLKGFRIFVRTSCSRRHNAKR